MEINMDMIIDAYKNSILFEPVRFLWDIIIKIFPFFNNFLGGIIVFSLSIGFYIFILYLIQCFLSGIIDILTYNKKRSIELLETQQSKEEYKKEMLERLDSSDATRINLNDKKQRKMFAQAAGVPEKMVKKMFKK